MSSSTQISINDINLLHEVIKSTAKVVDSAKITVNENGLVVYGVRDRIARCEVASNAIYSPTEVSFSLLNLQTLVKVLQTIKDVHDNDYTGLKFVAELSSLKFSSKKFKTKLQCCSEDVITRWISKKIETEMKPIFEFTTTSDLIKRVNSHSYIFDDAENLRVYLEVKDDMENNSIFASIGNRSNNLNNEMTLKFGIVTFGKLEDRSLILNLERLNLFNAIASNEIKLSLMDKNVLVSKTRMSGKNDSFFDMTIYNTLLKN